MILGSTPLLIVLALLAVAAGVWWGSNRLQQRAGLPDGKVIYTDDGTWHPNSQPLMAHDLQLVGKPDYLVEQPDGSIVPVEVKSSRAPKKPHEGHILQLAAYCFLVEQNYDTRPEYGILQYSNDAFLITYTADLEQDLLNTLAEMRLTRRAKDADRDHNDWRRCARCGMNQHCVQRMA